jgi:hypothetical protein
MRYDSKTCSSCRTILMFLSIEVSEYCVFILEVTPRICETAEYEPGQSEGFVGSSYVVHDAVSISQ